MQATQNLCSFVTRAKWGRGILIKTQTQLKGHVTLLINQFQKKYMDSHISFMDGK